MKTTNTKTTFNLTTSDKGRVAPLSPAAAVVAAAEVRMANQRAWNRALVKLETEALFAAEAEALEDWVRAQGHARFARARVAAGEITVGLILTAIWTEEGFTPPSVPVGPMSMDWDREEAWRLRREARRLAADPVALRERIARENWANRELLEEYRERAEPVI